MVVCTESDVTQEAMSALADIDEVESVKKIYIRLET
jgi:hypothetical protein